jgi:hypothetical protein
MGTDLIVPSVGRRTLLFDAVDGRAGRLKTSLSRDAIRHLGILGDHIRAPHPCTTSGECPRR